MANFFQEARYLATATPIFESRQPRFLEAAKAQLLQAADEEIQWVAIVCHEGANDLSGTGDSGEGLARAIRQWESENPQLKNVKILFVAGGHLHKVVNLNVEGIPVIEAGKFGSFTLIEVDDHGAIQSQHYSVADQEKIQEKIVVGGLREGEAEIIERAQNEVARIVSDNKTATRWRLPSSSEYLGDSTEAKGARRRVLGRLFAQSLKQWADTSTTTLPIRSTIGVFNTLSFFSEVGAFSGDFLNWGQLKALVPFDSPAGLFVIEWQYVKKMLEALRSYGKGNVRPFETPELDLEFSWRQDKIVSQVPLKDGDLVLLGTDGWTAINGYRIPEIDETLKHAVFSLGSSAPNIRATLKDHPVDSQSDKCAPLLASLGARA